MINIIDAHPDARFLNCLEAIIVACSGEAIDKCSIPLPPLCTEFIVESLIWLIDKDYKLLIGHLSIEGLIINCLLDAVD